MQITDIERDLDYIIGKKAKISLNLAKKWQWHILNEYPAELKNLVLAWAKDEDLPHVEYNDVSLERILNSTPFDFLNSVDLLYILHKDPESGYDIFVRSISRDGRLK